MDANKLQLVSNTVILEWGSNPVDLSLLRRLNDGEEERAYNLLAKLPYVGLVT